MNPHVPPATPRQATLERVVRGLFLAGWDGHTLSPQVRQMLEAGLRGVVLFAKNIQTPDQTAELCAAIHDAHGPHALIAIDQEGGRVARLRDGFFVTPPMATLGRTATPEQLHDLGRLLGLQLKALGIHLNFAPVLDVDTNPDNPVIGDRAFSADPQRVAEFGTSLAQGMQSVGVAACGKHFPGHGDTHQDSHLTLPRLPHGGKRLDIMEIPPFQHAIDHGIASIMTAHIVFESLNPSPEDDTPATLSPQVIQGLLRTTMGFDGVVISDDLEMKAIADHAPIEDTTVRAVDAGVDLMLVCHHPDLVVRAVDAIVAAVQSGRLSEDKVHAAHQRVERLATQYRPGLATPETRDREAQELAELEARFAALFGSDPAATNDPTDALGA